MRQETSGWTVYEIERTYSGVMMFELVDCDNDGDLDIVANLEYPENAVYFLLNQRR
jgi:hypothetical protein